jgi:hypothetical protein
MTGSKTQKVRSALQTGGSLMLLVFPLVLMIAFGLHFTSIEEFFVFRLRYEPRTASEFMANLTGPARMRLYTLPHLVGYLDLPLLIGAALFLGSVLFEERPWVAVLGVVSAAVGAVYMGGVFGSWLSFGAVGNVGPDQVAGAIPALEALTEMQGPMLLTTTLSGLGLLGLMVLGGGLFFTNVVPKWSPALIFLGNLMILVFMDLDNWMLIGALMMLIGGLPISLPYLTGRERAYGPAAELPV